MLLVAPVARRIHSEDRGPVRILVTKPRAGDARNSGSGDKR